ncbi:M56 family metallopeptidase [Pelomonas sp. SE-A7]|uniref:M56 family metallopeptidase n=1 Tax=Pelomonas sp. SE-A7 TaxID=3054953 RepID=UPI00259CC49A|nr:M56 family metallopeptidase [Pelomonas sp. SE-A7]MDM4767252.1 M56 family metallopeptidase [Pelomonas sp. SE-A7]
MMMPPLSDPMNWLALLARQTLVLGLAVPLLLALRRPLQQRFGASLAYASWLLLPLLMLAAWLPSSPPARALRAEVVTRLEPLLGVAMPALPPPSQPMWPALLAALWLVGALACLARLVVLQRRYMQGLTLQGRQWQGPAGSSPALVGLLKPRLALPADFGQRFDAEQQQLVLAHEEVHQRRRDNHWNALGALLCLVHWFNPLAWLALRRMRADQELACDAAVLARHPGREAAYGRALLLAQAPNPVPSTGLPWASWQSTHPLIERIEMLKQHSGSAARRKLGMALLGLLAVAGTGTVQALHADARPETASIELRMEIAVTDSPGGVARTQRSQPTLRVHPGKPALVMFNGAPDKPSADQLAIEVIAEDLGDNKVKLSLDLKKGDPLVSMAKPRLVTKDGVKALIELGNKVEYGSKDGGDMLSIAITPSVLAKPKKD